MISKTAQQKKMKKKEEEELSEQSKPFIFHPTLPLLYLHPTSSWLTECLALRSHSWNVQASFLCVCMWPVCLRTVTISPVSVWLSSGAASSRSPDMLVR